MINWGSVPKNKHEMVLKSRLDDLFKEPNCKFIHFDVAEGLHALGLKKYAHKGKTVRLNDKKEASVLLSVK